MGLLQPDLKAEWRSSREPSPSFEGPSYLSSSQYTIWPSYEGVQCGRQGRRAQLRVPFQKNNIVLSVGGVDLLWAVRSAWTDTSDLLLYISFAKIAYYNFTTNQHQNLQICNTPPIMIDGLPPRDIQTNDYYRRFIVLRLLLKRGRASRSEHPEDARRYEQIEQELQAMEVQFKAKTSKGQIRDGETILKIDDLHSNLPHIITKVKEKKQAFQGDLLKKWRAALILKKKREAESKKEKDAKSTSNKNLMYLTSQLLKKQRMSTKNIHSHEQKIKGIHSKMEESLKEADLQFRSKCDQLREVIMSERKRVQEMIEQYKQSLQTEQMQFVSQCEQKMGELKNGLLAEHEVFLSNSKGIKKILLTLGSKT